MDPIDIDKFIKILCDGVDMEPIKKSLEDYDITQEAANKEVAEFLFSRQNKELVDGGETFFKFLCDLYKNDRNVHANFINRLGEIAGESFVISITLLLSDSIEYRKELDKYAITDRQMFEFLTQKFFIQTVFMYRKLMDEYAYSFNNENDLSGFEFKDEFLKTWRNFRLAYQKSVLAAAANIDRAIKNVVYLTMNKLDAKNGSGGQQLELF